MPLSNIESLPVSNTESLPVSNTESTIAESTILEPLLNSLIETIKEPEPITPITPITSNIILNNLEELTNYVKNTLCSSSKITSINIIVILNNLLHIVEKYNTLTGFQKKMLVLDTLKKVINEQYGNSPEDLLEKQILFILIENTVPHFIDTLVSSINGKIKFAKYKETNCFTSLKNIFSCKK